MAGLLRGQGALASAPAALARLANRLFGLQNFGLPLGDQRAGGRTLEAAALQPYSWHQPKRPVGGDYPMFNDAKNMVSFVDGHVSYLGIYWNNTLSYPNGGVSVAAYYDPPGGYDYQWSGN